MNDNKNIIEIKININFSYILIKVFDFKKRENKKFHFLKKIIKRCKTFK